jgi:hypothetical protein
MKESSLGCLELLLVVQAANPTAHCGQGISEHELVWMIALEDTPQGLAPSRPRAQASAARRRRSSSRRRRLPGRPSPRMRIIPGSASVTTGGLWST